MKRDVVALIVLLWLEARSDGLLHKSYSLLWLQCLIYSVGKPPGGQMRLSYRCLSQSCRLSKHLHVAKLPIHKALTSLVGPEPPRYVYLLVPL